MENDNNETSKEGRGTSTLTRLLYGKSMDEKEREELFGYLHTLEDDELRVVVSIIIELVDALEKHPNFPDDRLHQSAIVVEEAGELTQACLQEKYEDGNFRNCIEEAKQTGAMAIRFLLQR